MAFDLATAKPSGFDISTAKPIGPEPAQETPESIVARINPTALTPLPKTEPSLQERVIGTGEAVATLATGATTGAAGFVVGALKGLAEQVRSGQFGTDEAADLIEKAALEGASAGTFAPKTEEGQRQVGAVGEVLQHIPPVIPVAGQIGSVGQMAKGAKRSVSKALAPVKEVVKGVFDYQSPTKQRIAQLIESGERTASTAGFKLARPSKAGKQTKVQKLLDIGGARVKTDPFAKEAKKQGFDAGVVGPIVGASKADKKLILKAVDILEKGLEDKEYAVSNRPASVAGNVLVNKVNTVMDANRVAGSDIDRVAKTLKGKQIDVSTPVVAFSKALDEFGVALKQDKTARWVPDFTDSVLSPGDRGPIKEIIRQMNLRSKGGIDALDVHNMKRAIDKNVTFGRRKTGMDNEVGFMLKSFRSGLDEALDANFPDYNDANIGYSETIRALNSLKDAVGKRLDFSGRSADEASGKALRKLMSNYQTRELLMDSIVELEAVARKHGGRGTMKLPGASEGSNNLILHALVVDEFDRMFGAVGRTTFQGQIGQALKQGVSATTTKAGAADLGIDLLGKGLEKTRGINEAAALKAIKELLKDKK